MRPLFSTATILACAVACCLSLPAAAQQQGFVKTKVHPSRAGVFVDGKYVGPAGNFAKSRKYALPPGEHEIKLLEPRYEEAVEKVNVQPGKTAVLSVALKPLPPAKPPFGMLRVRGTADKFTPVFVNTRFCGHAGEFNNGVQGLKLNPGKYLVRVGDGPEKEVSVEANKVTVVEAR